MRIVRKGFTLIELLVVIGIIAILAALLFPVFAQAKLAAKKARCISNLKQLATSINLYAGDSEDTMPRAIMTFAGGNYAVNSGGEFPADWRVDPTESAANAERVSRNEGYWANAILPYAKSYELFAIEAKSRQVVYAMAGVRAPRYSSVTMNGLLSALSMTAVDSTSIVPLLWYGLGDAEVEGVAYANPVLLCSGSSETAPCVFTSGGNPSGGVAQTYGHRRISYENVSAAVYEGNIYARMDTSAKFVRMAEKSTTNNLNVHDPYSQYDEFRRGVKTIKCRRPGETTYYWCHFRPDWRNSFEEFEILDSSW